MVYTQHAAFMGHFKGAATRTYGVLLTTGEFEDDGVREVEAARGSRIKYDHLGNPTLLR